MVLLKKLQYLINALGFKPSSFAFASVINKVAEAPSVCEGQNSSNNHSNSC